MFKKLNLTKETIDHLSYLLTAVIAIIFLLLGLYAWKLGWFTDINTFQEGIESLGAFGVVVFCLIQIAQIILPVFSTGVVQVMGVTLFGPIWGFIWNYLSVSLGSFIIFGLSKFYGPKLFKLLFSKDLIDKYIDKINNQKNFTRFFALAIFFPGVPDNLLCYLAGTTKMTWRTYISIILLGKPASIALYSIGFSTIYSLLTNLWR